jgi:hypothetical protein
VYRSATRWPQLLRQRVSLEACTARLPGGSCNSEHPPVHARRFGIKRQGLPRCSRPLQSVLAASPLILIFCSMRAGGEFGERHGGYRRLVGK